ncbi:MAG TPA: ABC transporter ATP-binding protein [Pseudonocardiaceae bacterium]|nr:ABC transporter ATP-binding protein [Pseudonocardiaceae bacterium]
MSTDTLSPLRAEGVGYVRAGQTILADVDVEVRPGERIAVVGPSGSGKTTLLAILAGLAKPTSGTVLVDGAPLPDNEPATRHGLAVVLQGYGLVALLTAAENIAIALRCTGTDPRDATTEAASALAGLGLAAFADTRTDQLSGGQQQRVAVARALALRPRILLADEPTSQQDPDNRTLVMNRILGAADHGATVLIATHDPEFAARCDRTILLGQR